MEKEIETNFIKEYEELLTIWESQAYDPMEADYGYQIRYNPMLSNFLQRSPCVTWVYDLRARKFNFISNNTRQIFGYETFLFEERGFDFCNEIKHPEDLIPSWKLIKKVWDYIINIPSEERALYKFNYDYRIIKPDGKVIRILEQNAVLQQDRKGHITHILGICNDITSWKTNGNPISSITSPIDSTVLFLTSEDENGTNQTTLSKRELEIVGLLAQGHSSKHIADKLCISFHTVNTHRQNMIQKTNTKNTAGLLQFASYNYLI